MAQSFQTTSGNLTIPGAYSSIQVQPSPGGLASNGVIVIIGEADQGPDYTLETNLQLNAFGPDQGALVAAKYKSGNLVDAFNSAVTAPNDPSIAGSPSRIIIVKTNASVKASAALPKIGGGTYATLADQSYGKLGNLVYFTTTAKTQEVVPTTGSFVFAVPIGNVDLYLRVNGGARLSATIAATTQPPAIVTALAALSAGLSVTGGVNRAVINAIASNLAATATGGNNVTFTFSGAAWNVTPTVGDLIFISTTSVVKGGANQNCGSYVVGSATATTILCTKLSDATGTPGTITTPITVGSTPIASTTADLVGFSPIVLTLSGAATNSSNAGSATDGLGKVIEFVDPQTNGSGEKLVNLFYALAGTKVTFLSTPTVPAVLISASEYAVTMNVNRQVDNVAEVISAGGQIALMLSYKGTTGTVTITPTTLTTTVVGGTGVNLNIALASFPTLNDLAQFINAQTGYSCKVGTATLGQMSSLALDEVVAAGICTEFLQGALVGATTSLMGRIKVDAAKFFTALTQNSATVQLGTVAPLVPAALGLPDAMIGLVTTTANPTYLAGGSKGGSLQSAVAGPSVQSGVDALANLTCNFVVPLFSQDATADITAALTESTSTYTIDAINAYVKTHVNAMSTLKRRRNRQAFLSKRSTFITAQQAASNIAAYRCSMTFQDVKRSAQAGIVQFQPWMSAVLAAGMQASAFYKGILRKTINCSGALMGTADFADSNDTNMEDALNAGLLPMKVPPENAVLGGVYVWASDQTTYGKDNNFFYNSIQATYVGDLVAMSAAQRMERMFVGQSVADISAAIALTALESIMDDFRRLKFLSPSTDAPRGYKNARVQISGPALVVSVEAKIAGLIYFVPISFLVTQVQQSA